MPPQEQQLELQTGQNYHLYYPRYAYHHHHHQQQQQQYTSEDQQHQHLLQLHQQIHHGSIKTASSTTARSSSSSSVMVCVTTANMKTVFGIFLVLLVLVAPASTLPIRHSVLGAKNTTPRVVEGREPLLCWVVQIQTHAIHCGGSVAGGDDYGICAEEKQRLLTEHSLSIARELGLEIEHTFGQFHDHLLLCQDVGGQLQSSPGTARDVAEPQDTLSGRHDVSDAASEVAKLGAGLDSLVLGDGFVTPGQGRTGTMTSGERIESSNLKLPTHQLQTSSTSRSSRMSHLYKQHSDLRVRDKELFDLWKNAVEEKLTLHPEVITFGSEHVHRRRSRMELPPKQTDSPPQPLQQDPALQAQTVLVEKTSIHDSRPSQADIQLASPLPTPSSLKDSQHVPKSVSTKMPFDWSVSDIMQSSDILETAHLLSKSHPNHRTLPVSSSPQLRSRHITQATSYIPLSFIQLLLLPLTHKLFSETVSIAAKPITHPSSQSVLVSPGYQRPRHHNFSRIPSLPSQTSDTDSVVGKAGQNLPNSSETMYYQSFQPSSLPRPVLSSRADVQPSSSIIYTKLGDNILKDTTNSVPSDKQRVHLQTDNTDFASTVISRQKRAVLGSVMNNFVVQGSSREQETNKKPRKSSDVDSLVDIDSESVGFKEATNDFIVPGRSRETDAGVKFRESSVSDNFVDIDTESEGFNEVLSDTLKKPALHHRLLQGNRGVDQISTGRDRESNGGLDRDEEEGGWTVVLSLEPTTPRKSADDSDKNDGVAVNVREMDHVTQDPSVLPTFEENDLDIPAARASTAFTTSQDGSESSQHGGQLVETATPPNLYPTTRDILMARREAYTPIFLDWAPQTYTEVTEAPPASSLAPIPFNDPAYRRQWHLYNRATPGMDTNVTGVWRANITGRGVTVAVVDDGVEWRNPDLRANYDPRGSWDLNDDDSDPSPSYVKVSNHHGTRCAGEIAAVANNRVCGVGMAYGAKIAGVRVLDGVMTDSMEAEAFNKNMDINSVFSCSWGPDDDGTTVDGPHHMAAKAMKFGVDFGRGGFGSIFVVASGNGGDNGDNCNFDGYANSIYTVTIGAVDEDGGMPYYAEECASMLGVTFSSGTVNKRDIVTTDWLPLSGGSGGDQGGGASGFRSLGGGADLGGSGVLGDGLGGGVESGVGTGGVSGRSSGRGSGDSSGEGGCTERHTGTSAAAPLAAGMVALMLEARPCLSWRDVQYVVALTARKVDVDVAHWQDNGAGLSHSHKHGFGLLSAWRLVNAARVWPTVPWLTSYSVMQESGDWQIPKGAKSPLTIVQPVTEHDIRGLSLFILEHVQLTVWLSHPWRGKVEVKVVSPVGTVSVLAATRRKDNSSSGFNDWTFTTVRCWGEKPTGNWTILVFDHDEHGQFDEGTLKKFRLTLFGTPMTPDEFQRRRELVESAMSGEFLKADYDLQCPPPPKYESVYAPVSERALKILILSGIFLLVMALYETFEYLFCYDDEKKEARRTIKLARRAALLASDTMAEASAGNTSHGMGRSHDLPDNGSHTNLFIANEEDEDDEEDVFNMSETSKLLTRGDDRRNIPPHPVRNALSASLPLPEVIPMSTFQSEAGDVETEANCSIDVAEIKEERLITPMMNGSR